eukprot:CAMPEP_0183741914 /NCGR_PEP_ID=MMETSP0737-20130205/63444_1 /TAXON_ID=385413 /ORGANISM="Thalassiosira miniscula, Strain CCMP1093" /LENGTH=122 /DNA_ID=CAMNT_0025977405 /DNA_START=84 /DNA_END=448 /DNA_ORIENTATION=+
MSVVRRSGSRSSSPSDLSSQQGIGTTNGSSGTVRQRPHEIEHHNKPQDRPNNNTAPPPAPIAPLKNNAGWFSNRGRSVLFMSLSLAVHLGGYELARATVMALFTSDTLGFGHGEEGGLSALP